MDRNNDLKGLQKSIKKIMALLETLSMIRIVLVIVAIFSIIVMYFVRPFRIIGDSMYPTLNDNDIGILNVFAGSSDNYQRFDEVALYSEEEGQYLVKRIIGLPGETIQYRNDILYVNGDPVEEYFLDEEYIKSQTNNNQINFTDDFGPIRLKTDEYFVCGDNRRVSKDSRLLGPFKSKDIISKNFFVLPN